MITNEFALGLSNYYSAVVDTRGKFYCKNVCIWRDGTVRPRKGHNGNCKWKYDGQVFYHV